MLKGSESGCPGDYLRHLETSLVIMLFGFIYGLWFIDPLYILFLVTFIMKYYGIVVCMIMNSTPKKYYDEEIMVDCVELWSKSLGCGLL